ncbi:hypothetical protein A2619_02020 [candidate division WWE3 bacterium RIFOXYD1_FULL_39_9]|uniref:Radical SAM core domain-containing protein n=1 Tax=candidate division WWE3 bacterium RIFOXYD1_FULL_39_9 TaxID=1802649 RepID=A0A1F4X510_UNCKA|nr:MAG: hypothetical protein A2619_02020 [candidate division WWE3 bacterium RIFOXYD1_FULL_39_9]
MYTFGPVRSRRLGISLGVDLLTPKTCSLDCIYCECGVTTDLSIDRKSFFPIQNIIEELSRVLDKNPKLDFITFSGSGEPSLSKDLEKVIKHLKNHYPKYKIALLTNATLLFDPTIRSGLLPLDLIVPSIDAVSVEIFQKINKPHPKLNIDKILNGLIQFRKDYNGMFWIEIFIVPGLNDTIDEITKIKEVCLNLSPNKIQLNTLDRPCQTNWVKPASFESLLKIQNLLQPLPVEIISFSKKINNNTDKCLTINQTDDGIIAILKRRPSTVEDLSITLNMKIVHVHKSLKVLEENGLIEHKNESRGIFYYLAFNAKKTDL